MVAQEHGANTYQRWHSTWTAFVANLNQLTPMESVSHIICNDKISLNSKLAVFTVVKSNEPHTVKEYQSTRHSANSSHGQFVTQSARHNQFVIKLAKAAQGVAQCKVSAYARSCRRYVATYWKEQTRRAQNCKYLP